MPYPDPDLTTVHLDATDDDPSQARVELLNAVNKINEIISNTVTSASVNTAVLRDANASISARRFFSNQPIGTPPLTIVSTTKVTNLNADKVDGYDFNQALLIASTPTFAGLTVGTSGIITDGTALRTKVIEIGDWNMDLISNVSVTHDLSRSSIRSIAVLIRPDNDVTTVPLDIGLNSTDSTRQGFIRVISDTTIELYRLLSGTFDSSAYDDTSYNRGHVIITYEA